MNLLPGKILNNIISYMDATEYPSFAMTCKYHSTALNNAPLYISGGYINMRLAHNIRKLTLYVSDIKKSNMLLHNAVNMTSLTLIFHESTYVAIPGDLNIQFMISLCPVNLRELVIAGAAGVIMSDEICAPLTKLHLVVNELPVLMHSLPASIRDLNISAKSHSKSAIQSWTSHIKNLSLASFTTSMRIPSLLYTLPNMSQLTHLVCLDIDFIGGLMPNLVHYGGKLPSDIHIAGPNLQSMIVNYNIDILQQIWNLRKLEVVCDDTNQMLRLCSLKKLERLGITLRKPDISTPSAIIFLRQALKLTEFRVMCM